MGCTNSKKAQCKHCLTPYVPVSRNCSRHVHHPAQRKGDSSHVVALRSTTLGSLKLDSSKSDYNNLDIDDDDDGGDADTKSREFSKGIMEAKTWSNMINEKIPKVIPRTPTSTPLQEPEIINTWELMEDIEDDSPVCIPSLPVDRSFSFHVFPDSTNAFDHPPKAKLQQETDMESPKPLWLRIIKDNDSNRKSKSIASDIDPEVIRTFRESMEELSPANPFQLRWLEIEKLTSPISKEPFFSDDDEDTKNAEEEKVIEVIEASLCPPRAADKVVLYFTSLRGVRKTYEDCCYSRAILKGSGVRVDERDVSMDYGFREELRELLGCGDGSTLKLPRVFVKGKCIGGAEEVKQLHEEGELEKVLEGCEAVEEGDGGICKVCWDVRFVICDTCSGSCKIYDGDEEEEEVEVDEHGFQRCPDCNENGIEQCPVCCY